LGKTQAQHIKLNCAMKAFSANWLFYWHKSALDCVQPNVERTKPNCFTFSWEHKNFLKKTPTIFYTLILCMHFWQLEFPHFMEDNEAYLESLRIDLKILTD